MKLITEVNYAKPLIIEEAGVKEYYIEGPFLQAELRNRNGRIYPLSVLQREVERYSKELIAESRALGELGHPDSPQINLDRVSHLIVSLEQVGTDFIGKAKIMATPYGNIVKSLIDENVKLGASSRGVGSLKTTSEGNVVDDDFYLTTAADIVADPSAPNAFVRGIMEGREWVWNNGILSEKQIAQYKKELAMTPKKKAIAKKLDEARAFQKFLDEIRVTVSSPLVEDTAADIDLKRTYGFNKKGHVVFSAPGVLDFRAVRELSPEVVKVEVHGREYNPKHTDELPEKPGFVGFSTASKAMGGGRSQSELIAYLSRHGIPAERWNSVYYGNIGVMVPVKYVNKTSKLLYGTIRT